MGNKAREPLLGLAPTQGFYLGCSTPLKLIEPCKLEGGNVQRVPQTLVNGFSTERKGRLVETPVLHMRAAIGAAVQQEVLLIQVSLQHIKHGGATGLVTNCKVRPVVIGNKTKEVED